MYRPILATLGFILSRDKKSVLLIHRNKRSDDEHLGKYNGLGGKMEAGEDVLACLKREIYEEAGIHCTETELRGTISWPGFGKNGENWFGFIFLVNGYQGEPQATNAEGDLHWKLISDLGSLPMWEGDKYFLPMVFDGNPMPFHGHMVYADGHPVSWNYSRGQLSLQ
ncbi:MAG TPA: 8-oxo-dGTP diphosphatase [Desulfocapsa sulfexigens]|nr:8-oxo-dGTP diphosphatase [Desulfocapsa sulfexigens]